MKSQPLSPSAPIVGNYARGVTAKADHWAHYQARRLGKNFVYSHPPQAQSIILISTLRLRRVDTVRIKYGSDGPIGKDTVDRHEESGGRGVGGDDEPSIGTFLLGVDE